MAATVEKILVTGATGNIGSVIVRTLIKASIHTTAFVRDEAKARTMFSSELDSGLLHFAVGDYNQDDAFNKAVQGHTRLFLLVTEKGAQHEGSMADIKGNWTKASLQAGVKQIVDLSSLSVTLGGYGAIRIAHQDAERRILHTCKNSNCQIVFLRPGSFYSNAFFKDKATVTHQSKLVGVSAPSARTSVVSTDDIGEIAGAILADPISKHRTTFYNISSEVLTEEERAKVYSRVLKKTITYEQQSPEAVYKNMVNFVGHALAYSLVSSSGDWAIETPISILLGKPPRKFEDWLEENKAAFM